jgi:hypothetical protein
MELSSNGSILLADANAVGAVRGTVVWDVLDERSSILSEPSICRPPIHQTDTCIYALIFMSVSAHGNIVVHPSRCTLLGQGT